MIAKTARFVLKFGTIESGEGWFYFSFTSNQGVTMEGKLLSSKCLEQKYQSMEPITWANEGKPAVLQNASLAVQ